jgi:hypothetical protein
MKTPKVNIACHGKVLMCAQFGNIKTNYAMVLRRSIGHLHWKPWIFGHGWSFLWTHFLSSFRIPNLIFFLGSRSHKMTEREGFTLFWLFFNSWGKIQDLVELTAKTVVSYGFDLAKISVDLPSNSMLSTIKWFLQKFASKPWCSRSSNLKRFLLNRQESVFFKSGSLKAFWMKLGGVLSVRCGIVFMKNGLAQIFHKYLVAASRK